jgi:hypothetical protein
MKTKTTLLRGKPLAVAALAHVIENPIEWNQNLSYHPKRSYGCYLHHVIQRSGKKFEFVPDDNIKIAADLLGIQYSHASDLYNDSNTLTTLKRLVKEIFGVKQVTLPSTGEIVKL